MSAYDKLVVAISNYGTTCTSEGAFVDQPACYEEFKKRRKKEFTDVLDAIGEYRDELLKNRSKKNGN